MTDLADALRPIVRELVAEVLAQRPAVPDVPDRLYGIGEAAQVLGIGRTVVYQEAAAGRLRSIKVGRRRLVAASDLADYIAQAKQAPKR